MLCGVVLCCVGLCYVMLFDVMVGFVLLRGVMLCDVMLRDTMLCYVCMSVCWSVGLFFLVIYYIVCMQSCSFCPRRGYECRRQTVFLTLRIVFTKQQPPPPRKNKQTKQMRNLR